MNFPMPIARRQLLSLSSYSFRWWFWVCSGMCGRENNGPLRCPLLIPGTVSHSKEDFGDVIEDVVESSRVVRIEFDKRCWNTYKEAGSQRQIRRRDRVGGQSHVRRGHRPNCGHPRN